MLINFIKHNRAISIFFLPVAIAAFWIYGFINPSVPNVEYATPMFKAIISRLKDYPFLLTIISSVLVISEAVFINYLVRKNEIIDYSKNDEIGSLVTEYNRMIIELEKSADLLAKSEREIAWREMAKQVAHEVKNPLTPMKLSVQYLLKAWDDKQPDFDDRLRRFRDAMIQQIETLSNIASEFSYFAKMPVAIRQETDVVDILENCLDFYQNNEGDVKIEFKSHLQKKEALVLLDKDQMLRVFNNIMRNAIQSIPSDRIGEIYIELKETELKYIVSRSEEHTSELQSQR